MKRLLIVMAFFAPNSYILAQWNTSGSNIYFTGGNVGIGTTDPDVPLVIRQDQNSETVVNIKNYFQGSNAKARYQLTTVTPFSYAINELQDFSGSPFYLFSTGSAVTGTYYESAEFNWRHAGSSNVMKISNGTVRIGNIIATPGVYKLYVEGGILTEKVKVAVNNSANWADHVFASDYQLNPLSDVADFIKKYKHLPGVPSAEQLVKEGGIDVNEMFAKQMEKIEELTLHLIKLNERIEQLELENKFLKKQ